MSKTNEEQILIKALKETVMTLQDMTRLLKLEYNEQNAIKIANMLTNIEEKEHLIEKLPGHYYIYRKRR